MSRKSTAHSSVENGRTALAATTDLVPYRFDTDVNFPGGTPLDGPSAGSAIALSMFSAMKGLRYRRIPRTQAKCQYAARSVQ